METTEIIQYKSCFTDLTFKHASKCLQAYDSGEFLSSIIWGAVFIEALLKDILFELDQKEHDVELNQLIRDLNYFVQNRNDVLPGKNKSMFRDIQNRCNEIRSKRNRLVHDTGVERGSLEVDARDVQENVHQIIKQYVKTDMAQRKKQKNEGTDSPNADIAQPNFPIFVSSITPHSFEQEEFINLFCEQLRNIGVKPVRCFLNDFDKNNPMKKVKDTMEGCNAVFVIGLERSHVYYYKDKEGSMYESENVHRKCTSAWLQIEAGMAYALNKPMFVLCQKDIHSDGIFDRVWNSYSPIEIDLPLDVEQQNVVMMLQKIKEFVAEYNKQSR